MLSHILPAVRDRANVFKVFDTFLAATSFIPIFCYVIFIFLFARAELVDILPRRSQTISKLMLLIFIPCIITLSELASFIGISYRVLDLTSGSTLYIGFASDEDQTLWTFLTSFSLALLTVYQAMTFSLAFYRLTRAVLNKRRIESTASDEAHLLRGIGWIAGGFLLGVVETVIGFSEGGFGCAITRRIMRLLARAALIIGIIRGPDTVDDFTHLEEELSRARRKQFRGSRLRDFISNPTYSTFRQLTPTASMFHSAPRAAHGPSPLSRSAGPNLPEKHLPERVTVHFENGLPSLRVRFSALEVPELPSLAFDSKHSSLQWVKQLSPATAPRAASFHPSSHLPLLRALGIRMSAATPSPTVESFKAPTPSPSSLQSPPKVYSPSQATQVQRQNSKRSTAGSCTSISTVHELASQFPPLPVRPLATIEQSPAARRQSFWDDSQSIHSQASTVKQSNQVSSVDLTDDPPATGHLDAKSARGDSVILTPVAAVPTPNRSIQNALDDPHQDFGCALGSGKSRTLNRYSTGVAHPSTDYSAFPGPSPSLDLVPEEDTQKRSRRMSSWISRRTESMETHRISWLNNPEPEEEVQLVRAVSLKSQVGRIKSIGKAPMRSTPRPTRAGLARSMHIEQIQIPPKENLNVEIIQGSLESTCSRGVLRDSEVLGIEDGS
ncbi:hypothetical protein H0H92_006951 [Tricholoma furcatifolium]|nr:hypothetical protein H0H92_006951 [Tricholoma furcatifolium]